MDDENLMILYILLMKTMDGWQWQVQIKGRETIPIDAVEEKNIEAPDQIVSNGEKKKKGALNKSLKRYICVF